MEDKIDSINKKVNFIVIVIAAQLVLALGTYLYYNSDGGYATGNASENSYWSDDAADAADAVDPAKIDVKSLDTPCACVEAALSVMKEIERNNEPWDKAEERSETLMEELIKSGQVYHDKLDEIRTKCVGDLSFNNADANDRDCPAINEMWTLYNKLFQN